MFAFLLIFTGIPLVRCKKSKFQNHHRIKCDTPLESWCSEVSENILYNMFAFLLIFAGIPVVGWWSSKSADEAQLQRMELKVSWWSSSGADGGYYIRKSLLLIALFLSTVGAVHKCLHGVKAVGSHSRWSFSPLVLFTYIFFKCCNFYHFFIFNCCQ